MHHRLYLISTGHRGPLERRASAYDSKGASLLCPRGLGARCGCQHSGGLRSGQKSCGHRGLSIAGILYWLGLFVFYQLSILNSIPANCRCRL